MSSEQTATYYKDKISRLRNILTAKQDVISKLNDQHRKMLQYLPQFENIEERDNHVYVDMIVRSQNDFDILEMYPMIKIRNITIRILFTTEEDRHEWKNLGYFISKMDDGRYCWKHCDRHAHVFNDGEMIITYFDPEYNANLFLDAFHKYPEQMDDIQTLSITDVKRHVRKNNDEGFIESNYESNWTSLRTCCKKIICQDHISLICEMTEDERKDFYKDARGGEYTINERHPCVFNERTKIIKLSSEFMAAMNRHHDITWMS